MNTTRATGTGAVSTTINPGKAFQLHELRLHLSAAGGAGNLTITLDANAGAEYDVVLLTQDMTSVVDLAWQPDYPMLFDNGDKVVVAWTNANSRTFGLEVKHT